jgi:fructose-1,6-bisphosphatase/inositol monophosphatase family enzyme
MRELLIELLADVYEVAKNTSKEAVKTAKDIVTACDIAIGELVRGTILGCEYPIQIVTEEFGNAEKNCETPEYSVYVDELDGTDNAFRCMESLPSVTLIQIAKTASEDVKFKDFVLVGAVEHASGMVYKWFRPKSYVATNC